MVVPSAAARARGGAVADGDVGVVGVDVGAVGSAVAFAGAVAVDEESAGALECQ